MYILNPEYTVHINRTYFFVKIEIGGGAPALFGAAIPSYTVHTYPEYSVQCETRKYRLVYDIYASQKLRQNGKQTNQYGTGITYYSIKIRGSKQIQNFQDSGNAPDHP